MGLIFDLRYALRLLKKSPGFSLLSVLVLAGGLAVSLFTFAFLYTLTDKPLPLPEQGSLYRASLFWQGESFGERRYMPAYEAQKIRARATVFAEHGVWQNKTVYLSLGDNNLVTSAVRASANIFQISRTRPLLGRVLQPGDGRKGQPPVVVISYPIWQSQFGGREDVIGQVVSINDVSTEIVGVMPRGYRFPLSHDLWLPISETILNPLETDSEKVELFGRLQRGVTEEQAERQIYDIASHSFESLAHLRPGVELIRADVGLFQTFDVTAEMKAFSFALNFIASFILILAAINIGNLLLARAIQRNKESAVRSALGAPQWRLITQLMWEGGIITVMGTLIALALVHGLLSMVNLYFHSLMNNELAFWYVWELDFNVVSVAVGFALATLFIACFLPAFKAARQDFNGVLRDGTRGAQGRRVGRLSRFLVTLQIAAVSIIMVLGAVISIKAHRLTDMRLGYDVTGIYFSIVDLPAYRYPSHADKALFFDKLQRNLLNNPSFSGATTRFDFRRQRVAIDGQTYQTEADKPRARVYGLIGATEFMGPNLVSGRGLDARDARDRVPTAVISESMAERYWSGDSPLDRRVNITLDGGSHWLNIVGVVSDTSDNPFEKVAQSDEIYLSGYQFPAQRGTVFFERAQAGALVEDEFFKTINAIDSQLDILTIEDWELETSAIAKMTVTFRDAIVISGLFALLLAMSGIYGLTVFAIEKRFREVGVRRALGATDSKIIGLFLRQGGRQLVIGLLAGVIVSGAMLLGAASILSLSGWVYGVIFVTVPLGLSAIVITAILVPSRRVVNVEPSVALRCE